jgi:hypothetical protein
MKRGKLGWKYNLKNMKFIESALKQDPHFFEQLKEEQHPGNLFDYIPE